MNRYFLKYDDGIWIEVQEKKYAKEMREYLEYAPKSSISFFHTSGGKSVSGRVIHSWRKDAYSWDEEFMRLVRRAE